MNTRVPAFSAVFLLIVVLSGTLEAASIYPWQPADQNSDTLAGRIAPPPGFERVRAPPDSFAAWLRGLPLKPADSPVLLYTGGSKYRQDVHVAVVDIDVGKRDLQQCADAIMRLRAEWLYGLGRTGEIAFNHTSGKRLKFSARGKKDYASFRKYMDYVFAYAGTYSLERELKTVALADVQAGDVFIKGGFPGHAVLVADVAVNPATGEKRFLLVQSFMPAQEIHVLKDPSSADSPWYNAAIAGDVLQTPEWNFPTTSLKCWP